MSVSAKSFVLDLLSTIPHRQPVSISALVRAASLFGIGENNLRVAVARLRARELVESDERGRYALGVAAEPLNKHVRSWRSVEDGVRAWDQSWVAIELGGLPRGNRSAARQRARALRLTGLRPLSARLHVRPNNLVGGVDSVRQRLESLGIGPGLVFRLSDLDAHTDRKARGLWDAGALEESYVSMRESLEESAARLSTFSRERAMVECFQLGGEALRQIVFDPLLPAPIVDTEKRRALLNTMRRYDRLGRSFWQKWAGDAIEFEQSPGDVNGLATMGETFAAAEITQARAGSSGQ